MKILITGGAGFIGSNLCHYHLNKGDYVHIVDNLLTGSKNNIKSFLNNKSFRFDQADIRNFNFLKLPRYDVVYHLASPASPIQYKKYPIDTLLTNSLGTHQVLEFFKTSQSKTLVISSTSEVYGDPLVHPQREDYFGNVNCVGPRACYDEGKRFAETLVINYFKKYGLNVRIARIFNTYGPKMEKDDGRVVSNFIIQALTKNPLTIYGNGQQTRSFCYVDDMINGLYLLAMTKNIAGEIINIGNPDERKITDLAEQILKITRSQSKITYLKIDQDDPKKRKPDISKARAILHWQPKINLNEGLEKTVNYFKERFL